MFFQLSHKLCVSCAHASIVGQEKVYTKYIPSATCKLIWFRFSGPVNNKMATDIRGVSSIGSIQVPTEYTSLNIESIDNNSEPFGVLGSLSRFPKTGGNADLSSTSSSLRGIIVGIVHLGINLVNFCDRGVRSFAISVRKEY